jgi:hypothetical protein
MVIRFRWLVFEFKIKILKNYISSFGEFHYYEEFLYIIFIIIFNFIFYLYKLVKSLFNF